MPYSAKYLVVVVDRGMTSEVYYFDSREEAKRAFGEIARDYGYEPEEINGSDKYDVSIWEWAEDRYEKVLCAKISEIFHRREREEHKENKINIKTLRN